MRMYDLIIKKRSGKELSKEEIDFIVQGYSKGDIPDYQMSAFLMAVYFKKMNKKETADFTMAIVNSGDVLDLSAIEGIKVDKHSTGGVGDTTTLVLGPIVAAAGVPVAKMSGRGLGHTGGTIDKLESFKGFNVELPEENFIENVNNIKLAVTGQTGNLAPADKKIYALRDVTATVDNLSLIASSIMSKKIAAGAEAIVLDVKAGSGAFMKTEEDAAALAREMVDIGNNVGRQTIGIVTEMNQPLGYAIGNALEVKEAIDTLKGEGPEDLTKLCIELGANMLLLAKRVETVEEGKELLLSIIQEGRGIEKLKEFLKAQGADPSYVDDLTLLPSADITVPVYMDEVGFVKEINAEEIGLAALVLGAGRETKESVIDLGVGIMLHKKIGDSITSNEAIATIYANDINKVEVAKNIIIKAYCISKEPIEKPRLIKQIIR